MEKTVIRNIDDIRAVESIPLEERVTTSSTYEVINKAAQEDPDAVALYFLMSGEMWESPMEITYGQLISRITQSANLFHELGVGPRDVVTYILPNLPQTHFALWGAETAGIVAAAAILYELGDLD